MTQPALQGFGVGLRAAHYDAVLQQRPAVDWFEVLSENYMEAHPGIWELLGDIRSHYPMVMHGVAMNIAGTDAIDPVYVAKLKSLAAHLRPAFISDHLCWTGTGGIYSHDLLPVPYTPEALAHVGARIRQMQDMLERCIVLENPSSYLQFSANTMPEWEFMAALEEQTGCALLLDINNVYVNAFNHGFDSRRYIDAMAPGCVAYMHLAGHTHHGTHIIDSHDHVVADEVWGLYRYAVARLGPVPTMVEWDGDVPPFSVLLGEVEKARVWASR